jgi:Holliday junction resolvasome RuvABC endonuclease subunit
VYKSTDKILAVEPKKKGEKRILALDQATHISGWSIYDGQKLIRYGTFETNQKDEIERISTIKNWLLSMLENWKPDFVAIEGIQFQDESSGNKMGITVFQGLARLQGVLMETCYAQKIDYTVCPTNTWRNHCGVKGRYRADKKRSMQLIAKKWYDISLSDDEADAVGIGRYAADLNKIEVVNWE